MYSCPPSTAQSGELEWAVENGVGVFCRSVLVPFRYDLGTGLCRPDNLAVGTVQFQDGAAVPNTKFAPSSTIRVGEDEGLRPKLLSERNDAGPLLRGYARHKRTREHQHCNYASEFPKAVLSLQFRDSGR